MIEKGDVSPRIRQDFEAAAKALEATAASMGEGSWLADAGLQRLRTAWAQSEPGAPLFLDARNGPVAEELAKELHQNPILRPGMCNHLVEVVALMNAAIIAYGLAAKLLQASQESDADDSAKQDAALATLTPEQMADPESRRKAFRESGLSLGTGYGRKLKVQANTWRAAGDRSVIHATEQLSHVAGIAKAALTAQAQATALASAANVVDPTPEPTT